MTSTKTPSKGIPHLPIKGMPHLPRLSVKLPPSSVVSLGALTFNGFAFCILLAAQLLAKSSVLTGLAHRCRSILQTSHLAPIWTGSVLLLVIVVLLSVFRMDRSLKQTRQVAIASFVIHLYTAISARLLLQEPILASAARKGLIGLLLLACHLVARIIAVDPLLLRLHQLLSLKLQISSVMLCELMLHMAGIFATTLPSSAVTLPLLGLSIAATCGASVGLVQLLTTKDSQGEAVLNVPKVPALAVLATICGIHFLSPLLYFLDATTLFSATATESAFILLDVASKLFYHMILLDAPVFKPERHKPSPAQPEAETAHAQPKEEQTKAIATPERESQQLRRYEVLGVFRLEARGSAYASVNSIEIRKVIGELFELFDRVAAKHEVSRVGDEPEEYTATTSQLRVAGQGDPKSSLSAHSDAILAFAADALDIAQSFVQRQILEIRIGVHVDSGALRSEDSSRGFVSVIGEAVDGAESLQHEGAMGLVNASMKAFSACDTARRRFEVRTRADSSRVGDAVQLAVAAH